MENRTAYPLSWPHGRPQSSSRAMSKFDTSFTKARDFLIAELERLGTRDALLSTNVPLRLDGPPRGDTSPTGSPGVAVYFTYKGKSMAFACDRWNRVGDNIHAIAKTIEALRGIARWGTGDMMQAAFAGFSALPAPTAMGKPWREILGCPNAHTRADVDYAYRAARRRAHPDMGGSNDAFDQVQKAYEAACREISA